MSNKQIVKARGILEADGKILLCESIKGQFYFLPGGTLETGENLHECLVREFLEETGLTIVVTDFVGCLECHWRDDPTTYAELNMIFNVSSKNLDRLMDKEKHIHCSFHEKAAIQNRPYKNEIKIFPNLISHFLCAEQKPMYLFESQIH